MLEAHLASVIARLDPKSGLPDFGIKLSKSETSDFDAIQYPGRWSLDRPVKPGDDSTEVGQPNRKMLSCEFRSTGTRAKAAIRATGTQLGIWRADRQPRRRG